MGVFDTISAASFPAVHKELTIVANIEKEGGTHREFFQLKKKKELIFRGDEVTFNGTRPRHQFVHHLENIPLSEEGKYEVEIYVDDALIGHTYFSAKLS